MKCSDHFTTLDFDVESLTPTHCLRSRCPAWRFSQCLEAVRTSVCTVEAVGLFVPRRHWSAMTPCSSAKSWAFTRTDGNKVNVAQMGRERERERDAGTLNGGGGSGGGGGALACKKVPHFCGSVCVSVTLLPSDPEHTHTHKIVHVDFYQSDLSLHRLFLCVCARAGVCVRERVCACVLVTVRVCVRECLCTRIFLRLWSATPTSTQCRRKKEKKANGRSPAVGLRKWFQETSKCTNHVFAVQ